MGTRNALAREREALGDTTRHVQPSSVEFVAARLFSPRNGPQRSLAASDVHHNTKMCSL
jgi:hypothetical protein